MTEPRDGSYAELRRRVASVLGTAGVEHAARESAFLVSGVLGRSPTEMWLDGRTPDDMEVTCVAEATERRVRGEPLAYILGSAEFRRLTLRVGPGVLIPRPETEGLVEHVLRWAERRWGARPWGRAIDVGTGSGCIALSLATEGRFTSVVGSDCSATSIVVAGDNAARSAARVPVRIVRSDLLRAFPAGSADVIVSNPPYISSDELLRLDHSVGGFEPRIALDGGPGGLRQIRELVGDGRRVLDDGGLLALEVDARRAERVRALAEEAGWSAIRLERDLFDRPRYLLMTRE